MFNPIQIVIDAYVEQLKKNYASVYGLMEPEYPGILGFSGHMALENIANSDSAYHDMNHTILVTDVGQEILRGKHLREGGVSPRDWLHFVISLLCHDIGYVRNVCPGDDQDKCVIDFDGNTITLEPGATDAALTPYHVTRSRLFARQRFENVPNIDHTIIEYNIEHTRFPVPIEEDEPLGTGFPSLLRSADLIGQMADIHYLKKTSSLYREFVETGVAETMGYKSPADLRSAYPKFFWEAVQPHIGEALGYLNVTQNGKSWVNNLYANVFIQEHS